MKIERRRYVVMRKNRTEVWCGLANHFSFRPIADFITHWMPLPEPPESEGENE